MDAVNRTGMDLIGILKEFLCIVLVTYQNRKAARRMENKKEGTHLGFSYPSNLFEIRPLYVNISANGEIIVPNSILQRRLHTRVQFQDLMGLSSNDS